MVWSMLVLLYCEIIKKNRRTENLRGFEDFSEWIIFWAVWVIRFQAFFNQFTIGTKAKPFYFDLQIISTNIYIYIQIYIFLSKPLYAIWVIFSLSFSRMLENSTRLSYVIRSSKFWSLIFLESIESTFLIKGLQSQVLQSSLGLSWPSFLPRFL